MIFVQFRSFLTLITLCFALLFTNNMKLVSYIKYITSLEQTFVVSHSRSIVLFQRFLYYDSYENLLKICKVLTISLYNFVLKIKCHKTHLSKRSRTADNVFPLLQLLYASHFPHDLIRCFSLASLMNILLYNTRILRKLNTSKADELRWKLPNDDGWGQ